ncbi:MAG: ATP-binding cassette domain-containing protein, partial [Clostridia bacterium]|nr:ATP-binding cassette domain-containing protein [Clostridia bacterium]
MKNPSFVHFENVCKYYKSGENRIAAADHVGFDIGEGEFVVIVGPSGAGKTTILNMLGGMDTCDEGIIALDGRVISGFNQRQLTKYRRVDVGFVFQFYNLVQNLTALENEAHVHAAVFGQLTLIEAADHAAVERNNALVAG